MVRLGAKNRRALHGASENPGADRRDSFAFLWVKSRKISSGLPVVEPVTENRMLPGCHSCTTLAPQCPDLAENAWPYAKTLLPLSIYVAPQSEVHCAASVRDSQAVVADLFSVVHGRHITDIRRLIRASSRDAGLYRLVPLEDIEQDVLVQLLTLIRRQPLSLFCDERLTLRLLACVVRRVVQLQARALGRAKRDFRRSVYKPRFSFVDFVCNRNGPALEDLANKDEVENLLARLPDHHRQVVWLRAEGHSWEEIAREAGGTPDGNRMLHGRAVGHLARRMAR